MSTFHFECDNLSDRTATVSTYFLAAFAMLYVVGESLPKTDFLTKIDRVIVISTVSLASTGFASVLTAKLHEDAPQVAELWNFRIEMTLMLAYMILNMIIFFPSWRRQRQIVQALSTGGETLNMEASSASNTYTAVSKSETPTRGTSLSQSADESHGNDEARPVALPTVTAGCDYFTVAQLQ
jgi:hypothetical protein